MQKRNNDFLKKGVVGICIFSTVTIYGTDYYVATSGSGTTCNASTPCDLSTALNNASDGDRIALAAGTYTGSGDNVVELTKSISLYGGWDGNNPPTINPDKYITTISGENTRRVIEVNGTGISLTLDGLHIVEGNATGLGGYTAYGLTYDVGGGIFVEEANVSIENCVIEHNVAGYNDSEGGGVFLHYSDGRVENSVIRYNTTETGGGISIIGGSASVLGSRITNNDSTGGGGGGGIYCYKGLHLISKNLIADNNTSTYGGGINIATNSAVLENNLILRNRADMEGGGIHLWYNNTRLVNNIVVQNYSDGNGGGIWAGGSDTTLVHTTVADNENEGVYLDKAGSTDCNMTLINTIITGEKVGLYIADGSHASLEGTLFWNNFTNINLTGSATVDPGSVTVTGNPAFRDPANGDYHITGFSAAIDAGVDAGVTEDIDGDPRPIGSKYDIGADETRRSTLAPLYYLLF